MLSKLEGELSRVKEKTDRVTFINIFSQRLKDENAIVVRHALKELVPFLETNQNILHEAATNQKPFLALPTITRSLLDACVRFGEDHEDIPILCARCLGLIGGLDPYKVEAVREKRNILVLSNFERLDEVVDFCAFLLERVLVKVFHSTTNSRSQGFLAYVMQELLKACGFTTLSVQRPRASQPGAALQRWNEIPETVRNTLTPFLSSRYMISGIPSKVAQNYPIFSSGISHSTWLRTFVYDLLQNGKGDNAKIIFTALARIIKAHDLSIATFILPFAVLNIIITGDEKESTTVGQELLRVLQAEVQPSDQTEAVKIKQCSEVSARKSHVERSLTVRKNVFQTLDYLALWLQEKRKAISEARANAKRPGRGVSEEEEIKDLKAISGVERILQMIPAEIISKRAVECGSYARALYHWEQYYRQERMKAEVKGATFEKDEFMQHLQFIYAQIDEPDSIEGISAHLQVLNPNQQIMEHRKAGRWTAAQSWYEISLAEKPNDPETQTNLLTCLKESGQYGQYEFFSAPQSTNKH
jgi:serine/threonine-protein kinase ATR